MTAPSSDTLPTLMPPLPARAYLISNRHHAFIFRRGVSPMRLIQRLWKAAAY